MVKSEVVMNLRAKFAFSIGLLGLLLMLSGSLWADTVYTYTGNPYAFCYGPTVCTGATPFLSISFDVKAGTPLDNLPLGSNITADVSAFSFTDGIVATITQANATSELFLIATNASGDIISWAMFANIMPSNGPVFLTSLFTDNVANMPGGLDQTVVDLRCSQRCGPFAGGYVLNDPGQWVVRNTPEPSSLLLFGTGLVGLAWRKRMLLHR
jgi:hypothetical protein